MISVAFINNGYEPLLASDPFLSFDKMVLEMSTEIDDMIESYLSVYDKYMTESAIMGELDEEKSVYLEAERTNIFDKIGNAVIALFKKVQEIIKNIIDSLKNIGFKNKENTEKMQELLDNYKKNDPEKYKAVKNDIIAKFNSGEFDPTFAKNVKEMDEAYREIIKLAKQKDVKPDSLRAKIDAMKKKFDDIDKPVKTTATIITVAVGIATFKSKVLDARKSTTAYEKNLAEENEEFLKALKELSEQEGGAYTDQALSKAQLIKNVRNWKIGKTEKLVRREQGIINTLQQGILGWIDSHTGNKISNKIKSSRAQYDTDMESRTRASEYKSQKAREAERDKNYEDAYDQARGRTRAQADAIKDKDYRNSIKQETKIKTKAQTRAQRYENDKAILNNTTHQNAIRHQSQIQAEGKEAGTPRRNPGTQRIALVDADGNNIHPGRNNNNP